MRRILRLTIKVSWAYVGVVCCVLLVNLLWHLISPRASASPATPPDMIWRISNLCFALLGFLILGALIYGAWLAVFRFSYNIISPTVFLVGLLMFAVAMYGNHHYLDPLVATSMRSHAGSWMPIFPLALILLIFVGWFKFNRVMPIVLVKVLFPASSPRMRTLV